MATNFCHKKLLSLLATQGNQLDRLYGRKSREIAQILKRYKLKNKNDVWRGNRAIEKELDVALQGLGPEIIGFILSNSKKAQNLSNNCYDAIVEKYTKGVKIPAAQKAIYFNRNAEALSGFLSARINGLDISNRVWTQSKDQIEFFLKEGLADGTSAQTIATDIKKYLKEPERRFRRIRGENGKLKLSNPAKDYHPGRGIYRSSYKNALRLARNEINIAYREADHLRRQELDFVVGFRVNLSNAHPIYDICDELVGVYPKNFRFVQWHPNCLCFTTTVLLSKEDFIKSLNNDKFDKRRQVRSIPKRAKDYLNKNADKIKGLSSKPYFIEDNFKNTKDGFELKKSVTK